jgi:Tol biopolymer transport system component
MTTERRFDRDLPRLLADTYLTSTPDYRDDVLAAAGRVRQRPAWTFPERWLPMAVVDRRRFFVPQIPYRALGAIALVALLIAALAVAYVGTHRAPPAPFGPAANGNIIYATGGDIFVRDSVTAAPRLLVGGADRDEAPTFSRQGDKFMFFRMITDTTHNLWVANADGSNANKIAGPFNNLNTWDWSPDGASIATGYDLSGTASVAIVPVDGSGARTLDVGMPASSPLWRPGSDQILFRGGDPGGDGALYLVRADGSGLTRLALSGEGTGGPNDFSHGVAWSPDGRRLAFETVDNHHPTPNGGGLRIHVADIDAAGTVIAQRMLEFDHEADDELNPAWLPTGDRIVFQTREGSTDFLSIGTLPPADATPVASRIGPSSTGGGGIGYEVAPDGRSLLVLFWTEQTTWRYDLDAMTAAPVQLGPLDVSSIQRVAP